MSKNKHNAWSIQRALLFKFPTFLEKNNLIHILPVSILLLFTFNGTIYAHNTSAIICPTDTVAPVITNCPSNASVPFDSNICGAEHSWPMIIATDDCDPTPDITSNYMSGDTFHQSDLVVIIATDSVGLTDTCSFYVTVTNTAFKIINCPGNVIKNADAICEATADWIEPTVFDNCNSNPTLVSSHVNGSKFDIDITAVYYYASNSLGNADTCSFNVIVTDVTPPFLTGCDLDTTIYPTGCDGVYIWNEDLIVVHDNCNAVKIPDPIYHSGYNFPMGTTTVTYKALDAGSLEYTCSFDVTVVDSVGPVATYCPNDTTVVVFAGCDTVVNWNAPIFMDGCGSSTTLAPNFDPGDSFPIGAYTVTYTAEDNLGNIGSCSFSLTVKDNSSPTMTPCPSDTTILATTNCEGEYLYKMPSATDACTGSITPIANPVNTTFDIGTHLVTITATDDGGNQVTCDFTVIVKDLSPPTTVCPQGIQVNTDGSINSDPDGIVSDVLATGCDMPTITFSFPPIMDNCLAMLTDSSVLTSVFPLGTTTYTYNISDPYGNGVACTFDVEVFPSIQAASIIANFNPVCPGSTLTLSTSYTSVTAEYSWTGPQSFTSSASTAVVNNFAFQHIGEYMVTITDGGCQLQPSEPIMINMAQEITASNDETVIPINTASTIDVLANDGLNSQNGVIEITLEPTDGTAEIIDNKIVYTPDASFTGSDHIFYEVCVENCASLCANAQVDIEINLVGGVDTCIIPNLITPNDDNLNDQLILDCLTTNNEASKILVYNQWGGLVYEAEPYLNDWSGTFDHNPDRPLPDGTYFYIFWKDKNEEPQKGFITLFR